MSHEATGPNDRPAADPPAEPASDQHAAGGFTADGGGGRGRGGRPRRTQVRWLMIAMVSVATAIAYIDRANLGVAAGEMKSEIGFSDELQGLVLSSFFWTYAVFQLPAGWLVDRFGAKVMYAGAVAWWSIWTAATALVRGVGELFAFRLLLGVGESPMQASNAKVVSEWFPRRERAFASSIFDTGSEFGSALSLPIVTALIAVVGWRGSFVTTGALGVLWVVLWVVLYRSPRKQRWTNQAEVDYIEQGGARSEELELAERGKQPMPWRELFRYSTTWALILGYTCRGVIIYFFITWYPDFLVQSQGFDLLQVGLYGAIPGLVAIGADWLGGLFSDWLDRRGVRLSRARKIPLVTGMLGASVIGLAALAPTPVLALTCLTVSFASAAFSTGALLSLPADVAPTPKSVGSLTGIQNLGSQLGGIGGPIMIGFLVTDGPNRYVLPLAVASGICVAGALVYALLVKVQPLDQQRPLWGRTTG